MKAIPGVSTHARERCADHFGRDADEDQWHAVVLAITDRPCRALLLARQDFVKPGNVLPNEVYRVEMHGVPVDLVWCADAGMVMTCGLPGMFMISRTVRPAPVIDPSHLEQNVQPEWARRRARV